MTRRLHLVWTVTLADLRMRARQFSIAVVGAALVLSMALVMSGLAGGFHAEAHRTVAATGADGFVVPAKGGGPFSSPGDLPGSLVAKLRHAPGVRRADPLVVSPSQQVHAAGRAITVHLIGVRGHGLGAPQPAGGRSISRRGQAVADGMAGLGVGDVVEVGGLRLHVVGTVNGLAYNGGMSNLYVSLRDAQQVVFGGRSDVTSIAVQGTPRHVPAGLQVMTTAATYDDMMTPLASALQSIAVCRDFLWGVALVIIGAVVYLSALERRRDFAVLKAIGSSTRWLYGGMAVQAALVGLASAALALAIEPLIAATIPMQLAVPTSALWLLAPIALVIGVAASLSSLQQVVRADPALAFGAN